MTFTPQEALQRTIEHREIFYDEMLSLMRQIMAGEVSPVMTAAILTGLRVKKETIGEIAAAATVMRELSSKVIVPPPHDHFLDVVGTGGDGSHTFNVSTTAAIIAAAAGATVAKHGGRSVSSKSGAADVLAQVLPQLMPGCAAAAFHGVIRTAAALRARMNALSAPLDANMPEQTKQIVRSILQNETHPESLEMAAGFYEAMGYPYAGYALRQRGAYLRTGQTSPAPTPAPDDTPDSPVITHPENPTQTAGSEHNNHSFLPALALIGAGLAFT